MAVRPTRGRQLELPRTCGWGGKRTGAGRKRAGRQCVAHRPRPVLASRFPVHVTLRMRADLPSLRGPKLLRAIESALREHVARAGVRLNHYSVQRDHAHLIVEAKQRDALMHSMRGLSIRIARRVNVVLERKGQVIADRYHVHVLKTPTEVRRALCYVLNNARRHAARRGEARGRQWIDPCSSAACFDGWTTRPAAAAVPVAVSRPRTWLLAIGWRRRGLIRKDEVSARYSGAP